MKFSVTEFVTGAICTFILGSVAGVMAFAAHTTNYPRVYDIHDTSVKPGHEDSGYYYTVAGQINECENQENWGKRGYRFNWTISVREGEVIGFTCKKPELIAQDWRERFITE